MRTALLATILGFCAASSGCGSDSEAGSLPDAAVPSDLAVDAHPAVDAALPAACALDNADPALRLLSPDAKDNPRPVSAAVCPAGTVVLGARYVSLGDVSPGAVDGVAPSCAVPGGSAVDQPSSDIDPAVQQVGAVTFALACPAGSVGVGVVYDEQTSLGTTGPSAISLKCLSATGETVAPNPSLDLPAAIELRCHPGEVLVGLAYQDTNAMASDMQDSIGVVCKPSACF